MTEAARRKKRNAAQRERRRLDRLHAFEERARASGYRLVGGIDEVGRGPLAGPVVAACVVTDGPLKLRGLNDSKQVLPEVRESLAVEIKAKCIAWAVGEACVEEIDRLNIYWASILAMERALASLHVPPEYLLTDAVRIKSWTGPQEPVIKGDAKCATVAAASIVAKVHRDGLLVALHEQYPQYGFHQHKGYASPQHIAALNAHGPCAEHRRAFWRVRAAWDALPGMEQFVAGELAAAETTLEPDSASDDALGDVSAGDVSAGDVSAAGDLALTGAAMGQVADEMAGFGAAAT